MYKVNGGSILCFDHDSLKIGHVAQVADHVVQGADCAALGADRVVIDLIPMVALYIHA